MAVLGYCILPPTKRKDIAYLDVCEQRSASFSEALQRHKFLGSGIMFFLGEESYTVQADAEYRFALISASNSYLLAV